TCVAFAPDGKTLASAGADNTIRLWNLATGELLRQFGHHALNSGEEVEPWRWRYNNTEGMMVAFAPDGEMLIATNASARTSHAWETATGKELRQMSGHVGGVTSVALSGDGKLLASAAMDGTIRLWDPATGKQTSSPEGHQGAALAIAFTTDGNRVLTAGRDN